MDIPGSLSDILFFVLVLGFGIILTVLTGMEWSVFQPGRRLTLWLVLAGGSWWFASGLLVQNGYPWQVWHIVNTLCLLFVTYTIGFWLSGEIEKSGHLIPVCILGTLVDIWSVFQGPSSQVGRKVMEHFESVERAIQTGLEAPPPPFVNFLILHWPLPGYNIMASVIGMGDLVFIALFLGSSRKFGLSLTKNVLLALGGLFLALGAYMIFRRPIPALPFICGLFYAGNYRNLSLTKKEWQLTIGISAMILLLGLFRWLGGLTAGAVG